MGRILAGGVRIMADWVNKLAAGLRGGRAAGRPGVAVHLEPLGIDYDARASGPPRTGEAHASDLD